MSPHPAQPSASSHGVRLVTGLHAALDRVFEKTLDGALPVFFPQGSVVFREGQLCQRYLIVYEGLIRVQKVSAGGRELILYRVGPGQSCVLSTSCLLAGETYPAEGVAETPIKGVVIHKTQFEEALERSSAFRRYVFSSFAKRITGFILLLEDVAFGRMDVRLAQHLVEHASGDGVVACTHSNLAAEFGTAREVISRLLKEFERNGWVKLGRGRIVVTQAEALRRLAVTDAPP